MVTGRDRRTIKLEQAGKPRCAKGLRMVRRRRAGLRHSVLRPAGVIGAAPFRLDCRNRRRPHRATGLGVTTVTSFGLVFGHDDLTGAIILVGNDRWRCAARQLGPFSGRLHESKKGKGALTGRPSPSHDRPALNCSRASCPGLCRWVATVAADAVSRVWLVVPTTTLNGLHDLTAMNPRDRPLGAAMPSLRVRAIPTVVAVVSGGMNAGRPDTHIDVLCRSGRRGHSENSDRKRGSKCKT
jgi:hypothetical protein